MAIAAHATATPTSAASAMSQIIPPPYPMHTPCAYPLPRYHGTLGAMGTHDQQPNREFAPRSERYYNHHYYRVFGERDCFWRLRYLFMRFVERRRRPAKPS